MLLVGVLCVGLGAVGAVVPGLPTTVFLLVASWCFTRSCPWLERKLIRENRLFRPFLVYLTPGTVMPMRARVIALVAMWAGVSASLWVFLSGENPLLWAAGLSVTAAVVGTVFILRMGRGGRRALPAAVPQQAVVAAAA
jgi:uncharacterized membrane protein YbaN (DUF454 family)